MKQQIIDVLVTELDEALFCDLIWTAWNYGTMSDNDFYNVADDEEFINNLAEKILKVKKGGKVKKFLKWLFIAPILFFGVWLIALCYPKFREDFISTVERLLNVSIREFERSL